MEYETFIKFKCNNDEKNFIKSCANKHDLNVSQYLRYLIDKDSNDTITILSKKMMKERGL